MSDPVSSIRNLGPAYEASLARVGVHSADQLRELGPDAAYSMLLAGGDRPHFIGYYALAMALQGRPWNDCKGAEKAALRIRFDDIKARHHSSDNSALEDALNIIGTGRRR
jgi:hypothetical protein